MVTFNHFILTLLALKYTEIAKSLCIISLLSAGMGRGWVGCVELWMKNK